MTKTVKRIVALVPDLMDRSRLSSATAQAIDFVTRLDPADRVDAALVVVDLARVEDLTALRRAAPDSRIVGFGPHVDDALLDEARRAGIDAVMPRSRFFGQLARMLEI
jgi:hypothetical protein